MTVARTRRAWIEVDLGVIRANAAALAAFCAPAELCAVVKADGYGHGAVQVAKAALDGGASLLAVAVVEEGLELRQAGVDSPILVLADAPSEAIREAVAARLSLTVSSAASIDLVAAAGGDATVHLKVDTGMHRVGCRLDEVVRLAHRISESGLNCQGAWTHLACADDPDQDDVTQLQLGRFDEVRAALMAASPQPLRFHTANSAVALYQPQSRHDLVRCGIALYGYAPSDKRGAPSGVGLNPALSLKAEITSVRDVPAGEGVSYGWRRRRDDAGRVATVPLGYADGVPRSLSEHHAPVLVRGKRREIAGTVTMDQLMIDAGDDVEVGDEVVLLGAQGSDRITADDWARMTGTISYEVLARLGPRLFRRYT
ncbi:MAG TPA: alanine racemase [Acidimicrobiales bacterium]|nr:alanine racemase [Acidimicrobiales bacterium]